MKQKFKQLMHCDMNTIMPHKILLSTF